MLLSNVNDKIGRENFIFDILDKLVFFAMFTSYIFIIKELKDPVFCRYGVKMYSGKGLRNTREADKTLEKF